MSKNVFAQLHGEHSIGFENMNLEYTDKLHKGKMKYQTQYASPYPAFNLGGGGGEI